MHFFLPLNALLYGSLALSCILCIVLSINLYFQFMFTVQIAFQFLICVRAFLSFFFILVGFLCATETKLALIHILTLIWIVYRLLLYFSSFCFNLFFFLFNCLVSNTHECVFILHRCTPTDSRIF